LPPHDGGGTNTTMGDDEAPAAPAGATGGDPQPDQGETVDFHRPKAAHSWREFAIEIGTIICGILIALSLEQLIDWSHARREVGEAREAVNAELASDAGRLASTASQDRCADVRLKLLEGWAAGKTRIDSTNLASIDNRPLLSALRASAWEIAKTGAVAAHMSVKDRLAYAAVYDQIANQMTIIQGERAAWIQLGRYAGKVTLDEAEARELREVIGLIRANADGRRLNTPRIEASIARLGVAPSPDNLPPGRGPNSLCAPPK
jgi:hypothetical protein